MTRYLNEISSRRCDIQLNSYPEVFIDTITNFKDSSFPNEEGKSLGSMHVTYVKGVSETLCRESISL
jgi:hypothetical protein